MSASKSAGLLIGHECHQAGLPPLVHGGQSVGIPRHRPTVGDEDDGMTFDKEMRGQSHHFAQLSCRLCRLLHDPERP